MMIVCGIDPGKSTGIAFYSPLLGKLIKCETVDFWGCCDYISNNATCDVLYIVELPTTKAVWHKAANKAAQNRTSVNVGSVIREAELIIELLKRLGCKYRTVHPQGKVDAATFKRITGYEGSTNSHSRDAGMLCFGVIN